MEIPFVFDNLPAARSLFESEPRADAFALAASISAAWTAFAHTGRPDHPGLPTWEGYSLPRRATMSLDYTCGLANDPYREDRLAFEKLRSERIHTAIGFPRY